MKKILMSQRLDEISGRGEYRDATDTRLGLLVWQAGFLPVPAYSSIKNLESYIAAHNPDGILLSGGNDIGQVPERDELEIALLEYSIENNIPVLGICRGMQMINHFCKGTLVEIPGHVRTHHILEGTKIFHGRSVNSYHGFGILIDSIGTDLVPTAHTPDGIIEGFYHRTYLWHGIMWHPERESTFSEEDLAFFQKVYNLNENQPISYSTLYQGTEE